jgi:tetrahydromethanopterin S-methyltransferase subunit H
MADQKLVRQLIQAVKEQQEVGVKFQSANKAVDDLKTAIAQEEINALEESKTETEAMEEPLN